MIHTIEQVKYAVSKAKQYDLDTNKVVYINLIFYVKMQDMIELHKYFKLKGYFSNPTGRYFTRDSKLFFHFYLNNDLNTLVEIRANENSLHDFFNTL
ncbi:MAG TPA: hypothetical protein VKN74_02835 [Candidatus Mcinerneyibacterium sp.]|nr:hypothetical protein [Candidatus Mcinerneyibacterium sp.]